jgi:hypothetical protein
MRGKRAMEAGPVRRALILALAILVGLGPGSLARAGDRYVEAVLPTGEIPAEQLLDVAIDLLSPSVDDYDRETLLEKGIQPSVRKAEARYIPIQLRNTLQATGQWGVVRVVPGGVAWAGLNVVGKIEKSNGKELKVRIVAWDATGRKWLDEDYKRRARMLSYAVETADGLDPFQSLYNEIANDLVKARAKRKTKHLVQIQEVARLRFAAEFAPDTFGPYLKSKGKGRYEVARLPAENDPMLGRLGLIRERDDMFVDTLNEYYSDFFARMDRPYDDYRANSYTEQVEYDSLNKSAKLKKIGGIIMGGAIAVQSGFKDSADSQIHKAALEELSESFGADVSGLVVDVDGRIVQLKGSAEEQFQQWRKLLKEIAFADVALPVDINVTPVPAPAAEAAPPPAEAPPPSFSEPVLVTPPDLAAPAPSEPAAGSGASPHGP